MSPEERARKIRECTKNIEIAIRTWHWDDVQRLLDEIDEHCDENTYPG